MQGLADSYVQLQ
jgi:hypothetical protein